VSLPRYPAYKDSGVERLGQVPTHWDVTRLRFVVSLNPSKSEVAGMPPDAVVSFLPMEAVGDDGSLVLDMRRPLEEVVSGYSYFRDGDVTIAKITPCFENGKGAVMRGLHGGVGFGTTELIVVRPRAGAVSSDYLHRLFNSADFRRNGESYMYGAGGQKRVPDVFVRDFRAAIPARAEQRAMCVFLDRETDKIDALIAEQRRLIELLKEKRHAVISHAVTKGLNPNALMKPSGVEWLGDVPAHWEVTKMKWVARMESGHTPDRKIADYWDGDIPWVSLNDTGYLRDNDYISETAYNITERGMANSSAHVLPVGTVVFSRDATIGRCGITARPMAVSQHYIGWVCGQALVPEFLLLRLRSMTQELERLTTGATLRTIGMPDVRTLVTPVPPLAEQRDIVAWVSSEAARLDNLIATAGQAVVVLQERRTALISAAVTGQIDVRSLAEVQTQ
jgi:type I restriction enzyme S subunit